MSEQHIPHFENIIEWELTPKQQTHPPTVKHLAIYCEMDSRFLTSERFGVARLPLADVLPTRDQSPLVPLDEDIRICGLWG